MIWGATPKEEKIQKPELEARVAHCEKVLAAKGPAVKCHKPKNALNAANEESLSADYAENADKRESIYRLRRSHRLRPDPSSGAASCLADYQIPPLPAAVAVFRRGAV